MSIATNNPAITSIEKVWDPDRGYSARISYTGYESGLETLRQAWVASGYKAMMNYEGAKITLTVIIPEYDGDGAYATDRFDIDVEVSPQSIWETPSTRVILSGGPLTALTDAQLVHSRNIIRIALQNLTPIGTVVPGSKTVGGTSADRALTAGEAIIYADIIRSGCEEVEVRHSVLRRNRIISINSSTFISMTGLSKLYPTALLITKFELPAFVTNRIATVEADLPIPAEHMVWAWKLRDDNSEIIVGTGKITEKRCWVFGCWSVIKNDLQVA